MSSLFQPEICFFSRLAAAEGICARLLLPSNRWPRPILFAHDAVTTTIYVPTVPAPAAAARVSHRHNSRRQSNDVGCCCMTLPLPAPRLHTPSICRRIPRPFFHSPHCLRMRRQRQHASIRAARVVGSLDQQNRDSSASTCSKFAQAGGHRDWAKLTRKSWLSVQDLWWFTSVASQLQVLAGIGETDAPARGRAWLNRMFYGLGPSNQLGPQDRDVMGSAAERLSRGRASLSLIKQVCRWSCACGI